MCHGSFPLRGKHIRKDMSSYKVKINFSATINSALEFRDLIIIFPHYYHHYQNIFRAYFIYVLYTLYLKLNKSTYSCVRLYAFEIENDEGTSDKKHVR